MAGSIVAACTRTLKSLSLPQVLTYSSWFFSSIATPCSEFRPVCGPLRSCGSAVLTLRRLRINDRPRGGFDRDVDLLPGLIDGEAVHTMRSCAAFALAGRFRWHRVKTRPSCRRSDSTE